jgi:hopene-associated glycosyltransferase HpnB
MTTTVSISLLSLAIWVYLLVGRGAFWWVREHDDAAEPVCTFKNGAWPAVVAVVPARNEADVIGRSIGSLLRQNYPGPFRIVMVDDQSHDGTEDAAHAVGREMTGNDRLEIVAGHNPPDGWTGKVWALHQGIERAQRGAAHELLLLTDADIEHEPDNLRALVSRSSAGGLVCASLMARLRCESPAERALIPAFVFFFAMLFPFRWVNRPRCGTAAAAGGCMLVRRSALDAVGGIASIRGEIIDDCALARRLKAHGPVWLGLSNRAVSLRRYDSADEISRMVARSAYAQLRYSPLLLAGTVLALALTFWVPPILTVFSADGARFAALAAWGAMAMAFQPMLRFYELSPLWGFAFPAIAAAYAAFTVESAIQHWRGRGGMWKGRAQALR